MADWRFYGRVKEMNRLEGALQLQEHKSRGFCAVRIVGRRGVGKTELLAEAGRRGTRNAPVLNLRIAVRQRRHPSGRGPWRRN